MWCSDINCSTRMVLAATWRSRDTKDLLPILACVEFSFDDLELLVKTPKRGYHEQFYTIMTGPFAH